MTKNVVKALHNNVVVKQEENTAQMYGNIMIPDTGKEKPLMGRIIDIGPGVISHFSGARIPITGLEIGDLVFFPSFGGVRITNEGEDYIVCKDADLLAVIKETTEIVPDKKEINNLLQETANDLKNDPVQNLIEKANLNFKG